MVMLAVFTGGGSVCGVFSDGGFMSFDSGADLLQWFCQCVVCRPASRGVGIETMTTWLPESAGLYVGARVRFKEWSCGDWSQGWRVTSIGSRKWSTLLKDEPDSYQEAYLDI